MRELSGYFARIGRRGGTRSRRVLDPGTARQMVAIREARRAARRVEQAPVSQHERQADTSAAAQAVQDNLWRRASASEKLLQVARLSRMVQQLSLTGLRQRHPNDSEQQLWHRVTELRLGSELASRAYRSQRARA